jgi:hypothetical protein
MCLATSVRNRKLRELRDAREKNKQVFTRLDLWGPDNALAGAWLKEEILIVSFSFQPKKPVISSSRVTEACLVPPCNRPLVAANDDVSSCQWQRVGSRNDSRALKEFEGHGFTIESHIQMTSDVR